MAKLSEIPTAARLLVIAFSVAGVVQILRAVGRMPELDLRTWAVMMAFAIVTARVKVRLIGGSSLSLLTAVVFATLMLLGIDAAVFVGGAGVFVQSSFPLKRRGIHRVLFN